MGFVTGEVSSKIDRLLFGDFADWLFLAKERFQIALDVFVDDQRRSFQIRSAGEMVRQEWSEQRATVSVLFAGSWSDQFHVGQLLGDHAVGVCG